MAFIGFKRTSNNEVNEDPVLAGIKQSVAEIPVEQEMEVDEEQPEQEYEEDIQEEEYPEPVQRMPLRPPKQRIQQQPTQIPKKQPKPIQESPKQPTKAVVELDPNEALVMAKEYYRKSQYYLELGNSILKQLE